MSTDIESRDRWLRLQRWTLPVLVITAIAARLLGTWCYRDTLNPDAGIAALMSKHMAEGSAFPVFFYGQAYMGSLEPFLGSLFCRLLGCSGFAVSLGTALTGILLLPVVYGWARQAGGRTAGMIAVSFCIVGTGGMFHYLGSPRGGYGATLLLGTLVLWQTARLAVLEHGQNPPRWPRYLLLGVAAGLGWWTNQLVLPALLVAGLVLLVFLGRRCFSWRAPAGLAGFLVGSAPFWIWNYRNGWQTFAFGESFDHSEAGTGLLVVMGDRLPRALDLHMMPGALRLVVALCYLFVLGTAIWMLVRELRGPEPARGAYLASALLFVPVLLALLCLSDFSTFDTPRYLLPLGPVLAVLLGVGTAGLARRLPARAGRALCVGVAGIAILGPALLVLPGACRTAMAYGKRMNDVRDLSDFLRSEGISAVYCPYRRHARNFLTKEEFSFTPLENDRYTPYARRAEVSTNVAVMCDYLIAGFLENSGGKASMSTVGDHRLLHDFVPPSPDVAEVCPDHWKAASGDARGQALAMLGDRRMNTRLYGRPGPGRVDPIVVTLDAPREVCGVRMLSRSGGGRERCSSLAWGVEVRESQRDAWRQVVPARYTHGMYWSGPRLYWEGIHARSAVRFPACRAIQLRIFALPDPDRRPWSIAEIQVLETAAPATPETTALDKLVSVLMERRTRRLYCDRWLANTVREVMPSRIETCREPLMTPDAEPQDNSVRLTPYTALLTRAGDAETCRYALRQRGINMRETAVGPWVLFDFDRDRGQWRNMYAHGVGLHWAGYTCFLGRDREWVHTLLAHADGCRNCGDDEQASVLLEQARDLMPNYAPVLRRLAKLHAENGRPSEARALGLLSRSVSVPDLKTDCVFENGARLIGVSPDRMSARPGEPIALRYYWTCPPSVPNWGFAVFVHFEREGYMFQDDHVLLEDLGDIDCQPLQEVFVENRSVVVPPDAPAGQYRVWVGIVRRDKRARRVHVKTALSNHHDAVRLPLSATVVAQDA